MIEDVNPQAWPRRAPIMVVVGALAGLCVFLLTDKLHYGTPIEVATLFRQAAAAGVIVAALSFLLTAERSRFGWAIAFAAIWGVVVALVGYSTGGYNRAGEMAEFPFFASLLAVGIAAPLFQSARDEGKPALPYRKVHGYAWTDAIIGGASLAFTGLTFLLLFLLGSLFDAIGIDLLRRALEKGWFAWMVAGGAFGAASAVLRERAPLLGTLQRLVMLVFSVLAPVLAFALAVYLVALPITGFGGLWKSGLPETPLLLGAAGFCFVFLNAIVGDGPEERKAGRLWRLTEAVLLFAVLPLGLLALISMSMRVGQYGWTPERLWGVIASLVAIAFGVANWLAVIRRREDFDRNLRDYQKWLAAALCGVALLLALPIVDFGAISTRSQMARLQNGQVAPDRFDWTALAFDFGPSGRRALETIRMRGGRPGRLAAEALASNNRYETQNSGDLLARQDKARASVRLIGDDIVWTEDLARRVVRNGSCGDPQQKCALVRLDANRLLLAGQYGDGTITTRIIRLDTRLGERSADGLIETADEAAPSVAPPSVDVGTGTMEIRTVTRSQLFVDGKPVGDPFE